MKLLLSCIFCILFLSSGWGQVQNDEKLAPKEMSEKDSGVNFLCVIDNCNKTISDAYNGLTLGLKAQTSDSTMIMVSHFRDTLENVINTISMLEVAPYLNALKNAHFEKLRVLNTFFISNSYKLVEYDNSKRGALNRNPEVDTKYIDQQISDFFKEMDTAQSQWQNLFELERDRLLEMSEAQTPIKK
jgi:hypothetical protein